MIRALINFVLRPDRREFSDSATPPPADPDRVHLFAGTFASELEATDYCLRPMGRNKPEPLTRDLPDAMINTAEVEVLFGGPRIAGAVPLLTSRPSDVLTQIGSDNTLILIAEAAFGGLPYSLNDTPRLRYLGPFTVKDQAPAAVDFSDLLDPR